MEYGDIRPGLISRRVKKKKKGREGKNVRKMWEGRGKKGERGKMWEGEGAGLEMKNSWSKGSQTY